MSAFDVVVVGGGPAGLSAALLLGRATRRVLVCDDGRYRNEASRAVHGFLSRDGMDPAELRRVARSQLRPYGVTFERDRVLAAERIAGGFQLTLGRGSQVAARALVLATGVVDALPPLPGLPEHFGRSVFLCPYCDGWEVRGRALGVHGAGGVELALMLTTWSPDVVLFAERRLAQEDERRLAAAGVRSFEQRVVQLVGRHGQLRRVELAHGGSVERRALFLALAGGQRQRSDLAQQLGLRLNADDGVIHNGRGCTNVPGVYVAGDTTKDLMLSIVAASEGAMVAAAADRYLREQHRKP